jgi:DNA-binding LytR/AlgR family response regulator
MPHSLRVLIVEDEWLLAEDVASLLREAGHLIVGPVASSEAGRSLIETKKADVALLDIQLNAQNSFGLAEYLQERMVPFAFLSGFVETDVPAHLRHHKALMKPSTKAEILATVDELGKAA